MNGECICKSCNACYLWYVHKFSTLKSYKLFNVGNKGNNILTQSSVLLSNSRKQNIQCLFPLHDGAGIHILILMLQSAKSRNIEKKSRWVQICGTVLTNVDVGKTLQILFKFN